MELSLQVTYDPEKKSIVAHTLDGKNRFSRTELNVENESMAKEKVNQIFDDYRIFLNESEGQIISIKDKLRKDIDKILDKHNDFNFMDDLTLLGFALDNARDNFMKINSCGTSLNSKDENKDGGGIRCVRC